ncbi:MAG TPA: hypothetical protein VE665_02690 [Hyphomicrobiaceae bacterium]|jgi:hypothetical protein|nr:hypothetical protein [Hyphomicrobiaceae bacterium]
MNRFEGLLFWAWVILSGGWVAAVLILMVESHARAPFAAVPLSWIVAVALGAPALCLGLALVGVWITRGYRRGP